MALTEEFSAYAAWRNDASEAIQQLRHWLMNNNIGDAQSDLRLQHLLTRLHEDRLVVAFVAEFSRGKSELINAILFSEYGQRMLPSSAGRTTMCPTELQWEDGQTPGIRLLPIATRARQDSVADLRNSAHEWVFVPINVGDAESVQIALQRVCETEMVSREEAERLGFVIDETGTTGARPDANGLIEVARLREGCRQFPHPLLETGLVIIDTPGLNAIGSEPELTLSLLPNAHVILFILAADTGVTQSDLAVWQNHVNTGRHQKNGRMIALNKIDGLWDGIRPAEEIEEEITWQVKSVAETLEIPSSQVFPISAQKALLAKFNNDDQLLKQSRISSLESALSLELLPAHKHILCENSLLETDDIVGRSKELLQTRLKSVQEQLGELSDLRGKNQSVIEYMMRKVCVEKEDFENGLQKYHAVRSVFTNLSNKLFTHIGPDSVRTEAVRARAALDSATFSRDMRVAMSEFFKGLRERLMQSSTDIVEISQMLDAMYKRFSVEHGLKLAAPTPFSTERYASSLSKIEQACNEQIAGIGLVIFQRKSTVTQRFFNTITQEARRTFELANRDVEQWLRAVMAPLETQVREYQLQLKRRLESVKRVHEATGTLEERVTELAQAESALKQQLTEMSNAYNAVKEVFAEALSVLPKKNEAAA